MVLRIHKKSENRIFKVYMVAMFALFALRYLLKVNVPAIVFLAVSMLPIWFGSTSEQLAFAASCIPFSVAFQYKYAILILAIAMLIKNDWRLRSSGLFVLIVMMVAWELWHAFYGYFDYVEFLRGFAEIILLGIVTSINLKKVNYKLVIRTLAISVVGVCIIMLVMQLKQFNYNILAVFSRSAHRFRFGQSNMESGLYALNFNANNLGFICNLSACGCFLLISRKESGRLEISLAVCSLVFAMLTMSRAAIVCAVMIFTAFLVCSEGMATRKIGRGIWVTVIVVVALLLLGIYIPSVYSNILERFQRSDVWNGRGSLFQYYGAYLLSSWCYFLFGIGMQGIFEKVSPYFPVHDVPHNGIQEVWVAWGIVGVIMILVAFCKIITTSKRYAGGKRQLYQYMPLALTLVFTMSGQLLTSSRALLALIFAYLCLCMEKTDRPKAAHGYRRLYE